MEILAILVPIIVASIAATASIITVIIQNNKTREEQKQNSEEIKLEFGKNIDMVNEKYKMYTS